MADDRRRLRQIQALALGQPFDDVDQHDIGESGLGDSLRRSGPNVAGTDDRDPGASTSWHEPLLFVPGC